MAAPHDEREVITSRGNPVAKRFRALRDGRGDEALAVAEGWTLLREAMDAGMVVSEVAAAEDTLDARRSGVLQALRKAGVPVRSMSREVLESVSDAETAQGVVALVHRPVFNEDALFHAPALLVIAVGVQNPGNLGGLLRTAEAAGASGAYVTRGSADPLSWKSLRGSMGSAFRLPHVGRIDPGDALARAEARRLITVATAADAETAYDAIDLRGPVALLVGGEASGLPPEIARRAQFRVRIPMKSPVESLNVGVAAGVVLFEAARQRRALPSAHPPKGRS